MFYNFLKILNVCFLVSVLQTGPINGQLRDQSYECTNIKNKFVHLPVKTGAPKSWMTININGQKQYDFEIELAPEDPDFYATLEVNRWTGKKLVLTAEKVTPDSKWINFVKMSDEMSDNEFVYKEDLRPQFHFSPRRGWTNDPNGLVFYKGTYHLFFQHNPFGTGWGNMTWGHAISNDLLHWTEKPDAVLPDKNGVVFSGSAVVDWKNSSGLQKNPVMDKSGNIENPPLVAFYTSTGADRGKGLSAQSMVYSVDEGNTWIKYPLNPVIPHIIGGNRDPKVFWFKEKSNTTVDNGRWIMALYMDKEDYALFSSDNLIGWKKICDIKDMGCSECPDMFELPVDGDNSKMKWVFWGGNGKYLIGTFDGTNFTKEGGPFSAKYGGNDYAAQTYSDIPASDGRRIMFSWMSGGSYPGMPFNQQFTVPRVITLRTTSDGVRMYIEPAKELESLRESGSENFSAEFNGINDPVTIPGVKGELLDIDMSIDFKSGVKADTSDILSISIFGQKIRYNLQKSTIELEGIKAPLIPEGNKVRLRLIVDRTSLELFANDGIVQIAKCFVNSDKSPADLTIAGIKGTGSVSGTVYSLKSVWVK